MDLIKYRKTKKSILFLFFLWVCQFSLLSYGGNEFRLNQNFECLIGHPLKIGIVSDIQYADKDSLNGRSYRTSLSRIEECVADFNNKKLDFAIQLGDIIDGHKEDLERTHRDLDSVVYLINHLTMPLYHVVGNHDMIAGKEYLQVTLGLKQFYYDFTIPSAKGWRFIVIDGNDGGYGKISDSQLCWFKNVLNKAESKRERVICFCHFALTPFAANKHYMAEPKPILEILKNTDCVKVWLAGHDHNGGYTSMDDIHHITIKGMVEAQGLNSYAIIELYRNKIIIKGKGKEDNRKLKF